MLHTLLLIAALVQFIFTAIGWPGGKINWVASGLACWVLTLII